MIPASYHAYFSDAAEVAGTLIGLLFVAVSVEPGRFSEKDVGFRIRAMIAFAALTDCLFVTLVALMPGVRVATVGEIFAIVGLLACAWAGWLSIGLGSLVDRLNAIIRAAALAAVFALQLVACLDLHAHPRQGGPVSTIAFLVLAAFAIAIERSWELVGASGFSVVALIERVTSRGGADEVEVVADEDVDP